MILAHEFPFIERTYEIKLVIKSFREILVQAQSRREWAHCPSCGGASHRVHSSYERRVTEQPCAGLPILLILSLHRFRCLNPHCQRATFVEPLEGLAVRHAQRTIAQGQAIGEVGLALGGHSGACLARHLGLGKASPSSVLRWVHRVRLPEGGAPQVVGIDDWAWRRGDRYGTIVVDLQRSQPIDLLADYSTDAIAGWLKEHPEVRVVVRDRSKIGRAGVDQGAPQAVQVADRFHLAKNLTDQLAAGLKKHRVRLGREPPKPQEHESSTEPAVQEPHRPVSNTEQRYAQMQQLQAAGYSIRAIARQVGSSRSTVHHWLTHGCPTASWGSRVRHRASRQSGQQAKPTLTCKQAAFLLVRGVQDLDETEREQLQELLASSQQLEPIYQLAQRFMLLLQRGNVAALEPWLHDAQRCAWSQLRQLARGLQEDLAAVQAALRLPYSNGPVEGSITRLKLLKRSMYGRAKLPLLRQRFLASP